MKWIFSYGSLIWRPAIPYIKRRKASLFGWRRRFWQLSSDHRGTFASPGRVVTLVRDDSSQCVGVAFGIADEDWEEVKTNLDYREKNGYKRHLVQIAFENRGLTTALTYIAGPENPSYSPFSEISRDIANQVLKAAGPSGTNLQYLSSLNESLLEMGAEDHEVSSLLEAVLVLKGAS
ncbi:MAG: gamma-glutamylcyclotransferase [Gammaproteobacteria bacterium]|jgi:cation transport protein ChaC